MNRVRKNERRSFATLRERFTVLSYLSQVSYDSVKRDIEDRHRKAAIDHMIEEARETNPAHRLEWLRDRVTAIVTIITRHLPAACPERIESVFPNPGPLQHKAWD